MKITPRRAWRIRDELRLWLRSRHGVRPQYSQEEIDRGREDLGFTGLEDALVAYTLFGGDLMPTVAESLSLPVSAEEISEIVDALSDAAIDTADLLIGE